MILLTDPLWINLLLLSAAKAKSLYLDTFLLAADKPAWIYFFGRFSGTKKAALEKFVPECHIVWRIMTDRRDYIRKGYNPKS